MSVAKAGYSVTDINGCFCFVGGTMIASTSVELYDPEADEWTRLAHTGALRSHFQIIDLNGFLYAFDSSSMEKYDSFQRCWKEVRALN